MRDPRSLHPVQVRILSTLSVVSEASFAQLNTQHLDTDWFSYHLKQTLREGFITKTDHKTYLLTEDGKKMALQFDWQTHESYGIQRVSVQVVAVNSDHFWIQQRLVEPYKGVWEFPTLRVEFGQSPLKTAERLLDEEAGIKGKLEFKGINHKIEQTKDSTRFDDKYLLVFFTNYVSGSLLPTFAGGTNHWLTKAQLLQKEKIHFNLEQTFTILEKNQLLTEITDIAQGY